MDKPISYEQLEETLHTCQNQIKHLESDLQNAQRVIREYEDQILSLVKDAGFWQNLALDYRDTVEAMSPGFKELIDLNFIAGTGGENED